MVTFLSAASALFLSSLIIVAIYRQKTHQVFQKHILLVAVYLLVCAIISNVVISVYVTTQGQAALQDGVILSKRVQATFDYLFGIAIGAFIFVATTTSINSRRDFVQYMKTEFPNSYVFYLFLMIITIVTILFSKVTFDPSNPAQIRFEDYFLFLNRIPVATLILYAPRPEGGDGRVRPRTDARPLAESGRRREERDPPESSGKRRHGDRTFHRGERASGRPPGRLRVPRKPQRLWLGPSPPP